MSQIVLNCFLIVGSIACLKYLLTRPSLSANITQEVAYDEASLLADIEDVFQAQNSRIMEVYVQVGQLQVALSEMLRAMGLDIDENGPASDDETRH